MLRCILAIYPKYLSGLLKLLAILLIVFYSVVALSKEQLNIGVLYSAKGHQGIYKNIGQQFNQLYPDIRVNFIGLLDEQYKKAIPEWLEGSDNIDVFYWQAGERLYYYARKGLLHPITKLWHKNNFSMLFPQTITEVVSIDKQYFAVPFTYYTWGMFYSKGALSKLGIDAPKNWQQLLQMCQLAKLHKINPIVIAGKEAWLLAAWFDYINLRLNGLTFHQELLQGKISYLDPRVSLVFEHWLMLKRKGCFNDNTYLQTGWQNIVPRLVRNISAGTLLANFIDLHVPEHLKPSLVYRPFPVINEDLPRYEDVPVDVFAIAANSKRKLLAEKFLAFIANSKTQRHINSALVQSAANSRTGAIKGYFVSKNRGILSSAAGIAQFYDRDMPQNMVSDSLKIIGDFMQSGDIDTAQKRLEALRQSSLKPE